MAYSIPVKSVFSITLYIILNVGVFERVCTKEGLGWLFLSLNNISVLSIMAQPASDYQDLVLLSGGTKRGGESWDTEKGEHRKCSSRGYGDNSTQHICGDDSLGTSCGFLELIEWAAPSNLQASLALGNTWQWNSPSCLNYPHRTYLEFVFPSFLFDTSWLSWWCITCARRVHRQEVSTYYASHFLPSPRPWET